MTSTTHSVTLRHHRAQCRHAQKGTGHVSHVCPLYAIWTPTSTPVYLSHLILILRLMSRAPIMSEFLGQHPSTFTSVPPPHYFFDLSTMHHHHQHFWAYGKTPVLNRMDWTESPILRVSMYRARFLMRRVQRPCT